ncbi:DeoR/GlpR family DNA-binding transcription regulator [Actinopolymorpha alba]|uniref:DeoR/GlpR family DNA-binding transcription regulator n=1 Tax=Actinopolymorpha alba TaxID=533267 RepID=UPI0003A6D911|nr:DeoR/GlpR family DNA-binding transcription regulator [Actinopolymorpha alba]
MIGQEMYAEERQLEILSRARAAGRVDVAGLAGELHVTQETVRRDLTVLERRGLLKRVHGGAIPVERLDYEPKLATRREQRTAEKLRIATAALAEVPDEGAILFDSGSTPEALARRLPTDRELTVLTNSLPIAMLLAGKPNLAVWSLGGLVRARTHSTIDDWARRQLEDISVEVAFLGTNGLSVARGLTTPLPTEAAVKAAMVRAGKRRVLLADHSKFGRDSFCRFASIEELDVVVTGSEVDDDTVAEIESCGPAVVRA